MDFDDFLDDIEDVAGDFEDRWDNMLDGLNDDLLDEIENFAPMLRRKQKPKKKVVEPVKTGEKEEKKIKKKKKESKFSKVAKLLKAKGLLQKNKNNFMDYLTFELDLAAGVTGVVTKELTCGYFDWTFSFFFNNEDNSLKFFKTEQYPSIEQTAKQSKGYKSRKKRRLKKLLLIRGHLKKTKKTKRCSIAGEYRSGNARRFVQWKKKKSFLLFAKCQPNPICKVDIHGQNISNWGLVASFKTVWKGSKRDTQQVYGKKRPCVFNSLLPAAPIRSYGLKRFKKSQTLIVHMWVNRIRTIGLIPLLNFDHELPDKLSVCLLCDKEYFHVNKTKLAMYSPVFHQKIFNEGLGDNLKNPIKIVDRFKPSIVRLALKAIFVLNARIPCLNVNKLLDFAKEYKITAILNIIEDSLINSRKCKHFNYQQKIELAYKYGLDGLKNNFCQLNNSFELIETNLNIETLHPEFKDQLKRKLACMRAAEAAGLARINEKKQERSRKRNANKLNKNAKKASNEGEGSK